MICAEEELAICALNLCLRYQGGTARRLVDYYGNARAVFEQPASGLSGHRGISSAMAEKLKSPGLMDEARSEYEWTRSKRIRLVTVFNEQYPQRLKECPDAPVVLYVVGDLDLNHSSVLSVVGTRSATPYGRSLCADLIAGLAQLGFNPLIVSGLAYGIDATAHKSALDNELPTVAVLPTGVDEIYPAAHRNLAKEITARGAVLSEFPSKTVSNKHNFLQRNRIIAGLSDATLVVESKENGGALITAHFAAGYSRDVLAVPGRPSDACSKGCNRLISTNKAALVTSARDIADALGWEIPGSGGIQQRSLFDSLSEMEKNLLADIKENGGSIDEIFRRLEIQLPLLSSLLTQLEVRGLIRCLPNKEYILPI